MKSILQLIAVLFTAGWCSSPAHAQTSSVKASARIRELLDPTNQSVPVAATAPAPRVGPAKIERPESKLPLIDAGPPAISQPILKPVRPASPPEPSIVTATFAEPVFPSPRSLPDGLLYQQIVMDLKSAPPLPYLGAYVKDRISLADPTGEISAQAILKPQSPERANPAPFAPWNLPDPFENWLAIQLRDAWPEIAELPVWRKPAGK